MAEQGEAQREGVVGPGVKGGDAWGGGEAGVGLRPAQSGGRRCSAPAVRESREADRGSRKWIVFQFLKFPGT